MVKLIIFSIIAFGLTTAARFIRDKVTLISVAIGCAINSNIYNSLVVPVYFGNLIFGIDSILYTLFMFTVIYDAKAYGIREAKGMSISTIIAIIISALIEYFAWWTVDKDVSILIGNMDKYLCSTFGTFVAIWVMLWLFEKFEKKNISIYLTFGLCVFIASIINSLLYFFGIYITSRMDFTYFWQSLLGSYIGKIYSIMLGLVSYYIYSLIYNKKIGKKEKKQETVETK